MNSSRLALFRIGTAAFTLIELLVVIVIIAILAAIMLPVMNTVRMRGDSIQCTSNLHQMGIAIGAYTADNDGSLPGPVLPGVLPTYKSTDTTSLVLILAKYLGLPTAPTGVEKAPIFICPSYAKLFPSLTTPSYGVCDVTTAAPSAISPFAVTNSTSGSTTPLKLSALTQLIDSTGKPISMASTIAIRDYVVSSTQLTGNVNWDTTKPVHHDHVNCLFFDWHVAAADSYTLLPK